jgi:hypothetical protein
VANRYRVLPKAKGDLMIEEARHGIGRCSSLRCAHAKAPRLYGRGMGAHDQPREPTRISDADHRALAAVSRVERRLFGSTIRYAVDQANRADTPTARVAARTGIVAAVQNLLARQIALLGTTIMLSGIVAEGAFSLVNRAVSAEVPVVATLFTTGGVILSCAMARLVRCAHWEKEYKQTGGPVASLPDLVTEPVRRPRLQLWTPIVVAAEFITLGILLMSAPYEAPRITGVFVAGMGILFLSLAVSAGRKRDRRSTF